MAHLFDPFTLRGVTLRNRIGMSPMCQYSYTDGFANDWLLAHLGSRAQGGAGLIIVEASAVEARGRITPFDLGIWEDAQIEPLARAARFIKEMGCVPGIQLAHAGRKASVNRPWDGGEPLTLDDAREARDPRAWRVVGASPMPFAPGYQTPHELSLDEIAQVQAAFVRAAERALAAGFEWIEIHGAHGYLIHSFYSPLSNQRADAYGGTFANRIRFMLETARKMRQVIPERLPLAARLSCTDWVADGWMPEDAAELGRLLALEGVDLIDCSSGGNAAHAHVPVGAGYQVPLSEAVRLGGQIATAAVGMITAPAQADEIIRNGRADLVLLGRELLRDPYWPLHAAQVLKMPPPVPPQYLRAF